MNDNTVESPIFLRTLDDAASIRFLEPFPNVDPADKEMVKMCMVDYLFQTYSIIQEVMCDPDWSTDSPALLDDWEEYMWMAFITDYNKLNEYLPGCRRPGFTMATLLWTVNAGIALLNVRWKKSVPWREMYDEGASGLDLPYVLDHYLVLYTKPVKDHTLHELMGELFTLTTRLYETDYHPELEIWIEWLGLRTYELIYSCDTKEVFDSEEYCIIRSHSENLWSASDGFICETQRLFCEFKGYMYKYNMYPRHMVSCTRDGLKTVQMSLGRHLIDIYPFPAGETIYCDMTFYLINFFDNDTRIESAIKKRWCKWLDSNIKQYYHDKTKITLQKTALGHVLRPGEIMRATHQKMGIIPSLYEVLKKNRPSGALDHIDFHLFASSWNDLRSYFEALDGIYDCRKDAILLCLIDQYLQHTYNLDFRKFFCREEINWTYNFKDIETSSHPLLIQIMGGWDVYYKGDLYHTRQFSRAFLVWCYKMHGFYSRVSMPSSLNIVRLFQQLGIGDTSEKESTEEPNARKIRNFWK